MSVSCDTGPAGLSSLVVESEGARIDVAETDGGLVLEVADPGEDLAGGALRCAPARSVQVVPGRVLGLPATRIIVVLGRDRPRIVRAEGRVRLLWLPGSAASVAAVAPPVESVDRPIAPPPARPAERPPAEASREEPPAELPRPVARAEHRESAPAPPGMTPDESPARAVPAGAPPDYLALERVVTMVASVETELRDGPGRRFAPAGPLLPGARIEIDGRAGDWIRATSGKWAFGPYFEAPEEALQGGAFLARIEAINAPVHAGPAPQHEIVAELYRGEQVVVDEVKSEWAHVRDGGWIRLSELSRAGSQ